MKNEWRSAEWVSPEIQKPKPPPDILLRVFIMSGAAVIISIVGCLLLRLLV